MTKIVKPLIIKTGDTRPRFRAQLLTNGAPTPDLDLAEQIQFLLRKKGDPAVLVNDEVTSVDAEEATVVYEWTAGQTRSLGAGNFEAEIEVNWSATDSETWPGGDPTDPAKVIYYPVVILEDIGDRP